MADPKAMSLPKTDINGQPLTPGDIAELQTVLSAGKSSQGTPVSALPKTDVTGQPLTPEDLAELEAIMSSSTAPKREHTLGDLAKMGISDAAGNLAGATSILKGALTPDFLEQEKPAVTMTGDFGKDYSALVSREFKPVMDAYSSVKSGSMSLLGLPENDRPEGLKERMIATGVSAAVDPTTYLFAPGKFAGMFGAAKPIGQAAEAFAVGAASEAGGTAGGEIGARFESPIAETALRVFGALTTGSGTSFALGSIGRAREVYKTVAPKITELYKNADANLPMNEIQLRADKYVKSIFIAAAMSDPKFLDVMQQAITAQKETGVKLPLSAILADNPVINTYIQSVSARNPEFHKMYSAQFDEARDALHGKATRMFGDPKNANARLSGTTDLNPQKAVDKRVAGITRKIDTVSGKLKEVDANAFGSQIVSVTDAAENSARAATSPLYKTALDLGRTKGVQLSGETVQDIYDFVSGAKASDIFKTFPKIHNLISQKFKPSVRDADIPENLASIDSPGFNFRSEGGMVSEFPTASVEDLDSLKRAINEGLRRTRSDADVRLLSELKNKINGAIDALDPEFVSAYRQADAEYLRRVGLPFNEETIKAIGRAKFEENVVPLLTRNKSTASQFLDATGAQGKVLMEKAFVSSLSKFATDKQTGQLIPAKAQLWLKNNKEALSLVPEVQTRVIGYTKDVTALRNQISALNADFVSRVKDNILRTEGMSAQQIVNKLYSDPNYLNRFMKQGVVGGRSLGRQVDSDMLKAVRSFLLDDIRSAKKPLDVLNDRTKAEVFNRVFGPAHFNRVKQLAIIADRITYDPAEVAHDISSIPKSDIERLTGAPPEMIMSRVTNRVQGLAYNLTALLNKYLTKRTTEATNAKLEEYFLDPNMSMGLMELLRPEVSKLNAKQMAEKVKSLGLDFVQTMASDLERGAVQSYRGFNEEQQQPPAP